MCDVIYWPFHNYSVHKTIVGTCHAAAKKDCPYFCQMFRYVLCKTTDKWLLTFTSFCLHLLPAFVYCLLVKLGQIVHFVMWFVKELNLCLPCILDQVKTIKKEVIQIMKCLEMKWIKINNSTWFTLKDWIILNTAVSKLLHYLEKLIQNK